jgi:predicted PurR-regulated permease PerM
MKEITGRLKSVPVILASIVILIAGARHAEYWLNPLLMAFFISIICVQPIQWLKKKKVPDALAILIVILAILAMYFVLIELVSKSLVMFLGDASKNQMRFRQILDSLNDLLSKRGLDISALGGEGAMDPQKIMKFTSSIFGKLSDMISKEITFIFLTIFLLTELNSISLKMQVLAKNTNVTLEYINSIGSNIRRYLTIKTFTSLITGVLVAISLAIIGVDYPILWGLVAFLLNYIPTIGSFIAAIPACIFSIVQLGFPASYFTIITFIMVNILIGSILEPKIMGKGLGLSTFIVFFSLIFWGYALGTVGMFLSIPIMMTIKIILEQNPKTKWIAAMFGTENDSLAILNGKDKNE